MLTIFTYFVGFLLLVNLGLLINRWINFHSERLSKTSEQETVIQQNEQIKKHPPVKRAVRYAVKLRPRIKRGKIRKQRVLRVDDLVEVAPYLKPDQIKKIHDAIEKKYQEE